MSGFSYVVKFHDENTAYSSNASKEPYAAVTTDREPNDPVWYAKASKITSARKELADASFKIEWYDNRNEKGDRPYSAGENITNIPALKTKIALYYRTSEDETPKPVTEDMMPAGAGDATGPKVSQDSYSTWSISYKNLLPKDEKDNDIIYMLKLADDFAPDYTSDSSTDDYIADNSTRKYSLLGKFTGKICWNDGGMDDELRPGSALRFVIKNGKGDEIGIASEDIIKGKTGNIWDFEVDNLVMYSDEGIESYYVTLDNSVLPDYEVSYTNAPKSTDVTKCHEGGTIFVTLQRKLDSFTIHKKWVDNNNITDRKALIEKGVKLYLWRYPVKKDVNGNVVTGTIEDGAPVNNAHGEQYFYELTEEDCENPDLEIHFDRFVEPGKKLDMYDTQGYQYVYYVTEIMGGSEYVTSYSNINPYTHIETAVANGGTLINLRKESIKIEGIVRWRVPSVTDYTKASATISLQKYDENSKKWVNVGSPVIVAGFTEANPQKKHVFPAVDKYDDLGREIKYRVIETNINYDGVDISVNNYKSVPDTENRYIADDYLMNGFDYTATAHPTWQEPSTEAEKYSFTVDNRMSGDVNLDIKKVWKTKEKYSAVNGYNDITIDIFQKDYQGAQTSYGTVKVQNVDASTGEISKAADGKYYATLTVDGKDTKIPITVKDDVIKVGETNLVWTFGEIKLPEFDSEGRAYTYSIKEASIAHTHATYDYKFDGRDIEATVNNSYVSGGGDSIYFEIDKEWIDGADLSQRQPVTVAIVNVDPTTGEYSFKDNAGETHEFVLSAENNWHKEVWLSTQYNDNGTQKDRFNKDSSDKWLWTVIEEDVSLKAEYEKLDGIDLSDEDGMDVIHRKVEGYPSNLFTLPGEKDATSITGNVAAIVHNDLHRPGYKVEIKATDSEGCSIFGAQKYKVTNTRVGKVNVTFDKTWHDSDNKANTRGNGLRVYLYQDGKKVVNDSSKESSEPEKYVYISGVTNPAVAVPAKHSASQDEYCFNNLPKYDEHGVAYQYSVREFMVRGVDEEIEILTYDTEDTTLSGYVADIEGHEAKVTFTTDTDKQIIRNEVYKYSNTLTGKMTTGVPFYVIWHDQSSYENGGRPDMYFTLYYRTIGSTDAPVKYEGDYKVVWETVKEEVGGEKKSNPYYKYATFTGLPLADEVGNAYEFFAAPSLNNAADHYYDYYFNDHEDASLSSAIANKETGIHHYDIDAAAARDKVFDLDGKKLIPVGGLVEYIIHEDIKPKGKKTWKNVDQGITAANLPNVKVYLGRFSDHDDDKKMYSNSDLSDIDFDKKLAVTTLDADKLSFDFETDAEPTAAPYAKYDYYGQIYTYQLAEKIYVNSTSADTYEVPDYIMEYNPDSLNLVNTYLGGEAPHKGSRSIKVTKNWAAKTGSLSIDGQYPQARFKLYRMEVDPANCNSLGIGDKSIPYNPNTTQYSLVTADLSKFVECGDEKIITYSTVASTQTAVWEDMPIYAPSGRPYLYLVKETDAHGMSAYTITNNGTSSADGGDRTNRDIGGNQVLISNYGLKPSETYNDTANQQSVEFTNTLKNNQTISKIMGKKIWTDSPYTTDVRPATADCNTKKGGITNENRQIKLELKRTAKAQTGVGNAITETLTEGTHYEVIWTALSTDEWKYEIIPTDEIGSFQQYAPNGQPYTYTVTEKLNDVADVNYSATTSKASISATNTKIIAGVNTLEETTALKNALKGQIQLFKKWDDALNEYSLRSGYVDVILQYREVGASDTEGSNTSEGWKTYKSDGINDSKYTLSYATNKWKTNVPNLPIKNNDGTKVYEYRVLEIDFTDHELAPLKPVTYTQTSGGVESTVTFKPDKESAEQPVPNGYDATPNKYNNSTRFPGTGHFETRVNNYIVNHSEIANLTKDNVRMLQVENFLSEKTMLTIEKKWDGIKGNNDYEVLPEKVIFKIQYSTNKDDDSSWKDLLKTGTGEVNLVTVSEENDWKLLVDNLPLNTGGSVTYYRAIELGTNLGRFEGYSGEDKIMSEKTTKPGVVHEHYGEYCAGESGSSYGSTECRTIATNTLATRDLTVKKKWNDDESAVHGDVEIELWSSNYKRGNDGTEDFDMVPGTHATLKASDGYKFTYHNLPLRNTEGKNIVYYVKEVKVDGALYDQTKYDTAFFVSTNGTTYNKALANSDACNIASIDKNGDIAKAVCIVNTPKSTLKVTKKWNDENDRHKLRKNVIFKLTDDNGGSWTAITAVTSDKTYSFEHLPIYKAPNPAFVTDPAHHMEKVTYTVTEDNSAIKVGGYKDPVYTVNGDEKKGAVAAVLTLEHVPSTIANNVHILNEKNPPKAIITADKVWDDEDNRHGSRTSQVELSLYYRVGTTGNWTLVTKKALNTDGNYSDGNVYTTSDVTQSLTQNEVSGSDANKWLHTNTFATWRNLPTYKDGKIIYYKVLETKGKPDASVSASYTCNLIGYEVIYSDINGSTFTQNGESKNQTVTNKLKRTEILVEKDWLDTAEQKIRPYSVTFEIEYKHAAKPWKTYTEDGKAKRIVVTGPHNSKTWTQIVEGLPYKDSDGYEYEYRLKEVSMQIKNSEGVDVDVYDQMDDDTSFTGTTWKGEIGTYDNEITVAKVSGKYKFTAVNTPDVGSITVTKVWDDNNNRDGLRPENIEVTLYRDGHEYAHARIGLDSSGNGLSGTTVDSTKNKWTYTWNNLPMYKDNAGVHDPAHLSVYYVVEDSISEDPVHNYKPATYGLLEDSITTINATHIQSHVSDNADTDLWIKNTHDPIRFKIDAYKKWDDSHADHLAPEYRPNYTSESDDAKRLKLKLQYSIDGGSTWEDVMGDVPVGDLDKTGEFVQSTNTNPQKVYSANAIEGNPDIWKAPDGWDNLPAYVVVTNGGKRETKLIEYRIEEVWSDYDKNTSEYAKHYETERPHFSYDIEEAKIEGKTYPKEPLVVENVADYNSTLTVIKEWDNKKLLEKYGALPSELHVRLQNWDTEHSTWVNTKINGVEQTAILKEHEAFENSWTHTFQNLTKEYKYRVIEEKIVFIKKDGNRIEVESSGITNAETDLGNGTIGNFKIEASVTELVSHSEGDDKAKHWVATLKNSVPNRKIKVTKNWNDEDNRDELRPDCIYVTLQRDGKNLETVMLHDDTEDANKWTHEWDYLPLYKDGSAEISEYRVIETDVHGNPVSLEGYEVSYEIMKPGSEKERLSSTFDLSGVENGQTAEITITNTHKPAKTTVRAGKQWDDGENKYGERANTIYLALFYKYQHEADSEWRLIDQRAVDTVINQYDDSLIHTTSDPVQTVTGQSSVTEYWENVAEWKNLPSQAVVNESGTNVIRIPEYRVVEVKGSLSDGVKLSAVVASMGGDITKVVNGYITTQPEAFFVDEKGGVSDNHIVINKLDTVSAKIIKEWDDQNNRFANRPLRIDFAIQKKKGAGSWELLTEKVDGKTVDKIVSVDSGMLGDNDNTWVLSVDGLPERAVDGQSLSYRAVEVSLVYADKTVDVFAKNDYSATLTKALGNGKNGYKTEESVDEVTNKTTIKNIQDKSAKVSVTKEWNDYDNGRKTRPLSVVFAIEKRQVHDFTVAGILATIKDFFKENDGWEPVYELNGAGEKVEATITLDAPDFNEASLTGLPLYNDNGKELVYRAREIKLIYENRTIDIVSGSNPYQIPTYEDDASVAVADADGITHSYTTKAINKIKPDPPAPPEGDPEPDSDPEGPSGGGSETPPDEQPATTPVIKPKDPQKPELPPELENLDEEIEKIEEPEDIIPIVDILIDMPDSPERDYLVNKLWEIVKELAKAPNFYDNFDPEMREILKIFVETKVLGKRRLPKTGGLQGSFIILLIGFALIGTGLRLSKKEKRHKSR